MFSSMKLTARYIKFWLKKKKLFIEKFVERNVFSVFAAVSKHDDTYNDG